MIRLSEAKLDAFARKFSGASRPVLLEHPRDLGGLAMDDDMEQQEGGMYGFTDNYLKVRVKPAPELSNKIINVSLGEVLDHGALINGEIVL